jgi:4-hydroxy-tetrahydrodipicolinate synthase
MIELPEHALRGSYTPLVTPFRDGRVDLAAYEQLVDRQVDGGSRGVVVNGTTAEPSTLTVAERNELVRVAVSAAAGRVTVVAATGSQSYDETLTLTLEAERAGADALLVVTPYYLRPPQRGLVRYFIEIGRQVELPLMMYHIPGRAAVAVEIDTLAAIAEQLPTFVGMKHAATDLGLISESISHFGPEFRIFVGLEELSLPMLALGAGGVMNAVGNIAPGRVAELCARVEAGDLQGARQLHYELFELNRAVFWDINPIPMKYMMSVLGLLDANEHRLPMVPATPELEFRLDELLHKVGLRETEPA